MKIMKIALIGNPNVGKSSVLNRLTGSQLFASNYPGTSMEITQAKYNMGHTTIHFYDTLGIYSIYSNSEEARITRSLLETTNFDLIINIVDAGNLERNLLLTYELMELDFPMLIVVNQVDRAPELGIDINLEEMSRILATPVLGFSARSGEGVRAFQDFLTKAVALKERGLSLQESPQKVQRIILDESFTCSGNCQSCSIKSESCTTDQDFQRAEKARNTARLVLSQGSEVSPMFLKKAEDFIDRPLLGTLSLLFLAYLALIVLTKFISFSEGPITALFDPISRIVEKLILAVIPSGFVSGVLSKAIPEGLVIPFTIIMPAMLIVSLLMALLEDSGLLPRYSVALERLGHFFGVSGQAFIPLSLGLACRTPAVTATRILPNDTQRFIIVTLLSIVVPCAATVGVLLMVSAKFHASLAIIIITMLAVMILLGLLLSRLMPQEEEFIYELPPLRIPHAKNLWMKIKLRFAGFFTEVLPLLLVMSIAIRILIDSGVLELFKGMESITQAVLGIPAEAFVAVLITVFQRYLAPLVLVNLALTPREATISLAMIALSLPCLPVMVVTAKELGFKSLFKILLMGLAVSASVGIILNLVLPV